VGGAGAARVAARRITKAGVTQEARWLSWRAALLLRRGSGWLRDVHDFARASAGGGRDQSLGGHVRRQRCRCCSAAWVAPGMVLPLAGCGAALALPGHQQLAMYVCRYSEYEGIIKACDDVA
jgi:hypothetical protein